MEWTGIDFARGMVAVFEWEEAERARSAALLAEVDRLSELKHPQRPPYTELARLAEEARVGPPLWYRIVGFNPWTARSVSPDGRREGIVRLLNVVRVLFAVEWGRAGEGGGIPLGESTAAMENGIAGRLVLRGEEIGSGGASRIFLGRQDAGAPVAPTAFYDPLVSICFYLGLAKSRLSALCLEATGVKILEFLDVVRVGGFRERLTDVLRGEMAAWRRHLAAMDEEDEGLAEDSRARALRFLKWMRVNARGVSRRQLAWELGMPTKARLTKAVFLAEGVTLEELEVSIAEAVLLQEEAAAFEAPTVETSVMMEILNARSAEKSELCSDTNMEPQRRGDTENKEGVRGELDSSLEGLGDGEVA